MYEDNDYLGTYCSNELNHIDIDVSLRTAGLISEISGTIVYLPRERRNEIVRETLRFPPL